MQPRFIVVEGADGAGKSTLIDNLHKALSERGIQSVSFQNPGTTELGKSLREILLNPKQDNKWQLLSSQAEFLLFLAGNAQLAYEVVEPALQVGHWVIMDRWNWSTLVYQVMLGEWDNNQWVSLVMKMVEEQYPNCCFWLDVDLETAKSRLGSERVDRYESKGDGFLGRLIQSYRDSEGLISQWYPVHKLDASLSPENLTKEAMEALEPWLKD